MSASHPPTKPDKAKTENGDTKTHVATQKREDVKKSPVWDSSDVRSEPVKTPSGALKSADLPAPKTSHAGNAPLDSKTVRIAAGSSVSEDINIPNDKIELVSLDDNQPDVVVIPGSAPGTSRLRLHGDAKKAASYVVRQAK